MTGCLQGGALPRASRTAARSATGFAGDTGPTYSNAPTAALTSHAPVHPITAHAVTAASLRMLPIFADTPDAALQAVVRASMLRRVARNAQVVRAGERTDFVYLVLSGTLEVLVGDEEGREAFLSELGPGELFGEMGVLDDEVRSATVVAVTPSELVAITKTDFKRFMKENFDVAHYVMRKLIQRLRMANRRIESLALLDITGRVARVLREMAETVDGEQVIVGKLCKQSIAKMIGSSREMVSRTMKNLEQRGLIEVGEGCVVLHDAGIR